MAKKAKKNTRKQQIKHVNSHDAFFKNTFSYPEIIKSYITHFMDTEMAENVDFDSLVLENNSFVTSELSEYFSDLVWHANYKNTSIKISLLFEHKSYVPKHPHPQLLRYIVEHLEAEIKAKAPFSVVIPIIIYHGTQDWEIRPFSDSFEGADDYLKQYIPKFKYQLTNLSNYSDIELIEKGIGKLTNVFLAMRHVRDLEYILKNFELIFIHFENSIINEEYLNFYRTILVYLFKNIELNRTQLQKIVTTINQPLKSFTMSAFDMLIEQGIEQGLEQGIEQGLEQGIEQGKIENQRKTILNILAKFPNWEDSQIAEFVDAEIDFVQQIRKDLSEKN
jgi:predicted transposase/invertase (TIGR01784 family)